MTSVVCDGYWSVALGWELRYTFLGSGPFPPVPSLAEVSASSRERAGT